MKGRAVLVWRNLIALALTVTVIFFGTTAWASSDDYSDCQLSFNSTSPSKGQVVTCEFSRAFPSCSSFQLYFEDKATSVRTPVTVTNNNGQYQFVMPALTPGDTYDVEATISDYTFTLYSFQAPVDPGHQLPEVRYAILLPISLLAVFYIMNRRTKRRTIAATE
ncbi:hypothetical protein [Alicyclobacillus fastidiosus]|uniref:Uncharacterized protein n=1 Tax=Alicyclobacillus fastidiosus TaxID=392011 RepID=A0ABV5AF81_9BACL|nr:hypothetical protein [Alicyclobacillus fastidiosus]WEH09692.1 hypothetical protein PYS47_24150 [Alicyclobacillus fastidiosus]